MMSDDKLICCGGGNYRSNADIYDFTTEQLINLTDMNNQRKSSGICVDSYVRNKLYVDGGEHSPNTFEYYDTSKNKWISLSNSIHGHIYYPVIWNYDANTLIVGSVYDCKLFERFDIRENKWYEYKINGKTFNDLFGVDIENDYPRLLVSS